MASSRSSVGKDFVGGADKGHIKFKKKYYTQTRELYIRGWKIGDEVVEMHEEEEEGTRTKGNNWETQL